MYTCVARNRTQATANQFYVNSRWFILTANKFEWRHIFLIWHPNRRRQTYLWTYYLKCVYLKALKDFRLVEDHYKQFVYPYYVRQLIYSCLTITNRCCNNILYCTLLLITGQNRRSVQLSWKFLLRTFYLFINIIVILFNVTHALFFQIIFQVS